MALQAAVPAWGLRCDLEGHLVEDIHAHAERHGSSYHVTFNGWYYSTCNGAHATSTVGIKLRVTRGRVEDGRWLVSRLQGTFDKSEAAQLGCISSSESTKALGRFTN
jgi:hypothetical protein